MIYERKKKIFSKNIGNSKINLAPSCASFLPVSRRWLAVETSEHLWSRRRHRQADGGQVRVVTDEQAPLRFIHQAEAVGGAGEGPAQRGGPEAQRKEAVCRRRGGPPSGPPSPGLDAHSVRSRRAVMVAGGTRLGKSV